MKTWPEVKQIDLYLRGKMRPELRLVLDARMLIDPLFRFRVECQRKLYAIIKVFGRQKIKDEAERVHQAIFNDPSRIHFQQRILALFPKK